MKSALLIFLLCIASIVQAQKLEAWLPKEAQEDPASDIEKAAGLKAATPSEAAGKLYALGRSYANLNQEDIALKYLLLSKAGFEKIKLEEPAKDLALEIHQIISSQENYER